MKKILFAAVILLAGAAIGLAGVSYIKAGDTDSLPTVTVEGQKLYATEGSWQACALPDFFPVFIKDIFTRQVSFSADSRPVSINAQNTFLTIECTDDFTVTLKYNDDKSVYEGKNCQIFDIPMRGDAMANITAEWRGGYLSYDFCLTAESVPEVRLSEESPVQGRLVRADITGIFSGDEISVDSPSFSPSGISRRRDGHSTFFYIPITYYRAVGQYPVSVSCAGYNYDFVLDVGSYDFTTISFTMDRETSAATVESRRANSEYRRLIHPLYYTKEDTVYWDGSMIKPVQETRISSEFGQIRYINNSTVPERHSGIDYAAPLGTPVYAPAAGKVDFAGFLQLSGNTVVIDHGLGVKSYFFHMDDVAVNAGDIVNRSELIGHVGTTGYSTGPHLHFQVSIENQPVNPRLLYKE